MDDDDDEAELRALLRSTRPSRLAASTAQPSSSESSSEPDHSRVNDGRVSGTLRTPSISSARKASDRDGQGTKDVADSDVKTESLPSPTARTRRKPRCFGRERAHESTALHSDAEASRSAELAKLRSRANRLDSAVASDSSDTASSQAQTPKTHEVDIVRVDLRGIEDIEQDDANSPLDDTCSLPTHNLYGHAYRGSRSTQSYPRLEPGANVFCNNQLVEDERLSSLPIEEQHQAPIGILPLHIAKYLHKFQLDGVRFLYRLYERRRGGLLADDMGLGKTVQMICFLGAATSIWTRQNIEYSYTSPRILVVVPASVVDNWRREIEKWTPFRVEIFASEKSTSIRTRIAANELDVLVVGERMFRSNCSEQPRGFFQSVRWKILVVDEIHVAKSADSAIYRALYSLPVPVKYGLTGTALQNGLEELWTVLSVVVSSNGPMAPWPSKKRFMDQFGKPLARGWKKDATPFEKRSATTALASLRGLLECHVMRRPKAVIEDRIPGKTDNTVYMHMDVDSMQGLVWKRFINSYDAYLCRHALDACSCGSGLLSKLCCHRYPRSPAQLEDAPVWRQVHPDGLHCKQCPDCLNLRLMYVGLSLACHALMLVPYPDDENVDEVTYANRMALMAYYTSGKFNERETPLAVAEQQTGMSCKLDVALKLLREFKRKGHKTIVFYENLRLGGILMRWATTKGFKFESIDGSTCRRRRQAIVDNFQTDTMTSLFFVSKKAGGTGLNITAADRVLIFEPCWNPTFDLQAQDRAHRLGQQREVRVYRLVVKDSIEDYKMRMSIVKNQMSSRVLDNVSGASLFEAGELKNMKAMLRIGDVFRDADPALETDSKDGEMGYKTTEHKVARTSADEFVERNNVLRGLCLANVDVDMTQDQIELSQDRADEKQTSLDKKVPPEEKQRPVRKRRRIVARVQLSDSESEDDIQGDASSDRYSSSQAISETQTVDDILHTSNVASRLVLQSTMAKSRHQQVLSRACATTGGINNVGHGDAEDWNALLDVGLDGNESPSEPAAKRRASRTRKRCRRLPEDDEGSGDKSVRLPRTDVKAHTLKNDTPSMGRDTQQTGTNTLPSARSEVSKEPRQSTTEQPVSRQRQRTGFGSRARVRSQR